MQDEVRTTLKSKHGEIHNVGTGGMTITTTRLKPDEGQVQIEFMFDNDGEFVGAVFEVIQFIFEKNPVVLQNALQTFFERNGMLAQAGGIPVAQVHFKRKEEKKP